GVSGNGQDELVEVLAGQRPKPRGRLAVGERNYVPVRSQMRRERVRLLPEAPLRNACVPQMSVAENIAFRSFDVAPYCSGGWLLRKSKLRERALDAIRDYAIRTPSADAPMGSLSGGNVQRTVLARELGDEAAVLIAANPCFGLDFAAVSEIHQRLVRAREAGTAVLLVSADLDEIFALADRIVVMSEGRIVHECDAESADLTEIGQHMAGDGPARSESPARA
ncbi:MAG TPA: ATP-binding cassette domain-containing protein, partial [Polyangiaceae bacterium]|nr:ATP-binding cassette domain-containing protein [Polyangiaceae bacterium]